MKIFLSWSGEPSKSIAEKFKNWLPNVLQYVEPYFSQQDIELGERWSNNIEKSLEEHNFGLIFVTENNINAPWINFEAGALSKNLKSRLVPIMCKSDIKILNNGPLNQFQSAKTIDKESIKKLILEVNKANVGEFRLSDELVEKSFEKWWEDLETELRDILTESEERNETEENKEGQVLIELANKVDNLYKNQNVIPKKEILEIVERMETSIKRITRGTPYLERSKSIDSTFSEEYLQGIKGFNEIEFIKLRENVRYLKEIILK